MCVSGRLVAWPERSNGAHPTEYRVVPPLRARTGLSTRSAAQQDGSLWPKAVGPLSNARREKQTLNAAAV